MPSRARLASLAVAATVLLAFAPSAHAAPAPFGHPCTAQDGVRFCPTSDLASRVASWDGTPLDVDVTLPATGDGPFPTILLLHGLGGTKTFFEGTGVDPRYNNVAFAKRGYAVITPTARGFGNSCGTPASRTQGCEKGWTRLGDMRYEIRDVQWLTGLLVDQGIVNRKAIGATGVSYGGGFSTMLAFLRSRVRLPDGSLAPWKSPEGRPIRLAAAWPRWPWTNGASIFTRNGRGAWSRTPPGVPAKAYADAIFAVVNGAYVAPLGSEVAADVRGWKALLDQGTFGSRARAVLDNAFEQHGVASLPRGRAAPLLLQTGWTDWLFPVPQALAAYDAVLARDPDAPIALQVGDIGHPPAANPPKDTLRFTRQGNRFLDAWLLGKGDKPSPGKVTAFTTTCPRAAPPGEEPYVASHFARLSHGSLSFGTGRTLRITSEGASETLAARLTPIGVDLCAPQTPDKTNRAASFRLRSPGVTLIGLPVITGRVETTGRYGQLDARLWDLDAQSGTQRLITRGAYRLTDDQRGRFRFELDGNGWRFEAGHRIVVELLGRDAPTYLPSPTPFSAKLTELRIRLPVRERRSD